MISLRDYQHDLKNNVFQAWSNGKRAVCAVSPTGSGKTILMGSIVNDMTTKGVVIAHRVEIVSQISVALSSFGIAHNIVAPKNTVTFCIRRQISATGKKWYDPNAMVTLAAVDTVLARRDSLKQWFADQRWWMVDECHHLLQGNKWGIVVDSFRNAVGLGVTATPLRADGKSLHRDQGGIFDHMVVGPSMRDLIEQGALCDYRIFAPPQSIDTDGLKIGSTGDFVSNGLRKRAHESRIVGDVVQSYLRFAKGLRGITFAVDVEHAIEMARAYVDAGVSALAVSAKTPDAERQAAIDKFERGVVQQLVNVDLFGEGFDVPAVEAVTMARPTASYGLYTQQFGRTLRMSEGKERGILIDHVGNVVRHGLPDAPRRWTLFDENFGKRKNVDSSVIPVTTCIECMSVYERVHKVCPFCGAERIPQGRSLPEQVDGDLVELDAAVLARMRGEIERVDGEAVIPYGASDIVAASVKKRWSERQEAQHDLRREIAMWAGIWRDRGASDSEIHRRFFFCFGTDIFTAQTLGKNDANQLTDKLKAVIYG